MGSQCCRGSSLNQDEMITSREPVDKPLHKASLSQQGSGHPPGQERTTPVEKAPNYAIESEQGNEPVSPNDVRMKSTSKQLSEHMVLEQNSQEIKGSGESKVLMKQSRKIKLGGELFIKLKDGSIGTYYTMGKVLGQGAFGKVWRVTHKTTGLVRAMKQLKKQSLIKEEEQRLFSEMNILKNLDHPHIVKLYELYQDESSYYLVTEYLSGGELFDRIKKMSSFSEAKAADYIRQILLAVMYCHEQNIVHRDLKPENVIFVTDEPNAQLKVIDFGTSRKFDNTKQMSKRLGTPYYIAPEVLNHQYNEKCDIWSCGVILYILLCGYPPFVAKTENQILEKVKLGRYAFDRIYYIDDSRGLGQYFKGGQNVHFEDVGDGSKVTIVYEIIESLAAKQALEDPWLIKYAPQSLVNQKVLNNLRQFQAEAILKQALLSYMVTQMSNQKDIEDLQKTFQALDVNNDGFLSKDELIVGLQNILHDEKLAKEEVDRILEVVDINQSGQVDFSEFLMAAMNQEKLLSVQKIEQAFKIFDANGDGFISKQELEVIMGDLDDDIWQQILQDCDTNHDGKISYEEFTKMLKDKAI